MFYYPPYHATYWNAGNKKKSKKHQQQQQQQILQHQQLQQHQSQIPPQLRSQPPSRCQSAASDFLYPRYATASQHQPRRPFPAARQYLLDATYAAGSYQGSYQGSSPTSSDFDEQRLYAARRGIQFPATAITSPSGSHQHQHHLLIHQHNHHHHHQHQHPLHQQRDLVFDACSDSQASQDGPPSSRDNPTASSVTDQEESDTNHAKQEPAVDDADVEDDADMDDGGEDDDDAAGVGLGARRGDGDAADCNNDDEEVDDEDEEEDDDNRSMRLQMESDERASSVVRLEYEGIYSELRAACGVSQGRCTIPSTSLGISNNCDPVSSPDPSPLPTAAVVSVGGIPAGCSSSSNDPGCIIAADDGNDGDDEGAGVDDVGGGMLGASVQMMGGPSNAGISHRHQQITGDEFPPPPPLLDVGLFDCDGTCPEAMKEEDLLPGCPECDQFSTLKKFKQQQQHQQQLQLQVDWVGKEVEENISTRLLPLNSDAEMQVGPSSIPVIPGRATVAASKQQQQQSRCQAKCLSCLAIVCGIVALGSLAMAVVSDQWVFTQEPVPIPPLRPVGQRVLVGGAGGGSHQSQQSPPSEQSEDIVLMIPSMLDDHLEGEAEEQQEEAAALSDVAQEVSLVSDTGSDTDGGSGFDLAASNKEGHMATTAVQTFKIGLWIVCQVPHANKSLNLPLVPCMSIDYSYPGDQNSTVGRLWMTTDFLARVLSRIRISTPFHLGSLFLMGTATLLGLIGFFMEDTKTLAACALYIMAGLGLGSGLLVYISVLTEEVAATADTKRAETTYHFGWSFFLAVGSFSLAELAALLHMVSFFSRSSPSSSSAARCRT